LKGESGGEYSQDPAGDEEEGLERSFHQPRE
jgi:hypothetical protein